MPHVIGVVGNLGAGKTSTASLLSWYFKNQIEARGGHIELFANYDLLGASRMRNPEDWFEVARAHGSICVWDEAHRSFDSRKALKFENTLATDILTFARKMASIQIFATPSIRRLDTRIREMLEVLIHVRQIGKKGIALDFYDFQADGIGGAMGRFLHTKTISGGKMTQIHKLNLFDSHSFVGGFPLPKNERAADKFMNELEKVHNEARRKLYDKPAVKYVDSETGEIKDQAGNGVIPFPLNPSTEIHQNV